MSVLMLDESKDLFKNEAAYQSLIERFRDAMANDEMPIVLAENRVLFTAICPAATQDMLCRRIVDRLAQKPELLDAIAQGLKDKIVD